MNDIRKLSRSASVAVALLNLVAVVSPIRADALDTPGGYNLEFVWHQFHWLNRPLNFEVLFLLGGGMLVFGTVVHSVRVMSKNRMLGFVIVAFVAQLTTRLLVDVALVTRYHPPFHQDPWRVLAFVGGLACLISLCVQAAMVVQGTRNKTENKLTKGDVQ
jgi:hypothetical protein